MEICSWESSRWMSEIEAKDENSTMHWKQTLWNKNENVNGTTTSHQTQHWQQVLGYSFSFLTSKFHLWQQQQQTFHRLFLFLFISTMNSFSFQHHWLLYVTCSLWFGGFLIFTQYKNDNRFTLPSIILVKS